MGAGQGAGHMQVAPGLGGGLGGRVYANDGGLAREVEGSAGGEGLESADGAKEGAQVPPQALQSRAPTPTLPGPHARPTVPHPTDWTSSKMRKQNATPAQSRFIY